MIKPLISFFIILISCSCVIADETTGTLHDFQAQQQNDTKIHRIVGGRVISIAEARYQVAIFRDRQFSCAGSLISSVWVLTAAHCVDEAKSSSFMIRVGSDHFKQGGQSRGISKVIMYGGYNRRTSDNDLAMMKVRKRLIFNENVQPIKLASSTLPTPPTYFISGWGLQDSENDRPTVRLRGVEVNPIQRSKCAAQYRRVKQPITNNMICAAAPGKDSCQGDSGGPLVYNNIQYGVVSFGIGCARSDFAGVYVNLRVLSAWVNKIAVNERRHIRI